MEIVKKGGVKFFCGNVFSDRIKHGFTLRFGGVSEGCYASLNVGTRRGDAPGNAERNILIASDALGLNTKRLTLTYQTHTTRVRLIEEADVGKGFYAEWGADGVDGVVTKLRGVPLMCCSADCVPTLLADEKAGVIGAVHGGWRGTAGGILQNALALMYECGCEAENIKAVIGPAIGICCYEVSADVGEIFAAEYPSCVVKKDGGKYMLDLKKVSVQQLKRAGLSEENIENSFVCTSCRNDLYFSHRAQGGKSGLLGGFIQL